MMCARDVSIGKKSNATEQDGEPTQLAHGEASRVLSQGSVSG